MSDHEKMLERVRALLAKAASTTFEAEAESFRAKADELMTKYAIEQWQIDQAEGAKNARQMPTVKHVDFGWYWKTDKELGGGLWSLFLGVAAHCRCSVAHKYASNTVPVIGMPADLAYMDMLFTHLFMQMVNEMDPLPKPGESFIEALVKLKECGLKWDEIASRLRTAGYYDDPRTPRTGYSTLYTNYCRDHGRERVRVTPVTYRRSFAMGFSSKVKTRLRGQREEQGQSTGSNAIALRDISIQVREVMFEMFPDMAKKKGNSVSRNVSIDSGALARGSAAGAKASIISNASQLKGKREVER